MSTDVRNGAFDMSAAACTTSKELLDLYGLTAVTFCFTKVH